MFVVNRSLVIIKPKQPYVDWVMGLPGPLVLDRDEITDDLTTILIPEVDNQAAADDYIRQMYHHLFEIELAAWHTDPQAWPQPRDYEMFVTWFDLELHMLVLDSLEDAIEKEPY